MVDDDRVHQAQDLKFCSHANCKVLLKTTYIYPSDIMPETPPRINQRSCSHYFTCGLLDKSACTYAVTQVKRLNTKV